MGKIYSSIYHGVMKIGMYFLPWRMPEIIEGEGSITKLPRLIKKNNNHKVLIVTDKVLMGLGLLNSLIEALNKEEIEFVMFDEVSPNPTDVNVEKGVKLYLDNKCDAMIAFGGGSPMDCAKAIGARIAKPKKSIEKLQGLLKILKKIPTIYTVPTTSGTGSETTIASVITIEKTHHKASINDISLIPPFAVLDPLLTVGLPPKVTSTTGMDALCHAVECYTNHTYNTKLENDLAKKAVKLIYDNLYTAYKDGKNIEARQNMQKAALYAGRAFTRGCVGYVHAIGHTLGGLYGLPHGLAMSILLPHVMKAYGKSAYKRLAELADVCGIVTSDGTNESKAKAFIAWIEDMKAKMDIPVYPDCIQEKDIDQIVDWAYKEANPLYPTTNFWTKQDFKDFIHTLKQFNPTSKGRL